MSAPPPPATERRVPSGDALLRVRVEGAGPPVVLVHGWALDLEIWEPQAAALREAYRVVRYDRPGFGGSTGTPSTAADLAALERVVAALDLPRFALVASSQAGRGALRYALAHPERLTSLVLDGVPLEGMLPGPRPEHAPPIAELAALLRAGGAPAVRERVAADPFFQLHRASAAHRRLLAEVLGRYPASDLAAPPAADSPVNVAARLAEITAPALVLNGEHDSPHRRLTGDALAYALPRARRVVFAGAGHLANLDCADDYSALLREFLDAHANAT